MVTHVIVQLLDGIRIGSRSDIEQEAVLRLEEFAHGLEEPLVRVNLTIVTLFNAKHEVDAAALQDLILYTEVPSSSLETVQNVGWDLIFRNSWVHDLGQLFHGKLLVLVDVHEAFLK